MSIRIGKGSRIVAQRRFYDDTYLHDKKGAYLFVCDAAVVQTPSGRVSVRTHRDVVDFPDADVMAEAILEGGWSMAPLDGDPMWKPSELTVMLGLSDD